MKHRSPRLDDHYTGPSVASLIYCLGFQCLPGSEFQIICYDKWASEPQADTSKCRTYSLKTTSLGVFLVQFWICLSFKRIESFTKRIVNVWLFFLFLDILWNSLVVMFEAGWQSVPAKTCKMTFKPTVEAEIFWKGPRAVPGSGALWRCERLLYKSWWIGHVGDRALSPA